jgi:hypothetical protein
MRKFLVTPKLSDFRFKQCSRAHKPAVNTTAAWLASLLRQNSHPAVMVFGSAVQILPPQDVPRPRFRGGFTFPAPAM